MYCQKCRTPLKADSTLNDLNPAAFDLLVTTNKHDSNHAPISHSVNYPQERKQRYDQATRASQSPLQKRTIPPPRDANPGMSFVEVTESQVLPSESGQPVVKAPDPTVREDTTKPLSWQLLRNERLYSLLSAQSDIDHPVCVECSALTLSSLNTKLTSATRERDAYSSFLKQLQHAATKHRNDEESIRKELLQIQQEEETMYAELVAVEEQKRQLEQELADLDLETKALDLQEQQFWLSRNAMAERRYESEAEYASLQQKLLHDQKQFTRLQRTNVYNDTFYISHDGNFGTINGLRLGRLPNIMVDWPEINAAWGQTLLLLQTLAERLGFSFRGYKLRPLGSTSRIEKVEQPQIQGSTQTGSTQRSQTTSTVKTTILELYTSGAALERVFQSRKFDQGMVAFLDCLNQLGQHVETTSLDANRPPSLTRTTSNQNTNVQPLKLPYSIEGDKIWARGGDSSSAVSIKLGVGLVQDENFAKACKYVLTCCKYLLAHVSNLDSAKIGG